MSEVQTQIKPQEAERQTSPGPERSSTNNPFRRGGTGSPLPSPGIPGSPSRRPATKNPFLDGAPTMDPEPTERASASPPRPIRHRAVRSPTETEGLLANMSLDDSHREEGNEPRHKGHRSQEGRPRPPGPHGPPGPGGGPGPGRRPMPRGPPRPRRNSDTSISERKAEELHGSRRGPRPGGERGPRPARDAKEMKDSQGRPIPQKDARSKRSNRRLDTIDKLDLTGIYGEGLFHHDGPFDACNPHRNRKNARAPAPMSAFAADSLNNAIGGSGPLRKNIDLDRIHGHQPDSFNDFSAPAVGDAQPQFEPYMPGVQPRRGQVRDGVDRTTRFDPTSKVERLHGDESLGLGTSTFLEGTPAPRSAIQRRESEGDGSANVNGNGAGLTRKKSLVQRIRGMSNNNRPRGNSGGAGGAVSPDGQYQRASGEVQSAGGLRRINERNPFFEDHDAAYAAKGASIEAEGQKAEGGATIAAAPVVDKDQEAFTAVSRTGYTSGGSSGARTGSVPAGSRPHGADRLSASNRPGSSSNALQRAVTEGSQVPTVGGTGTPPNADDGSKPGGGFLNRVKSLRGGRKDKAKA